MVLAARAPAKVLALDSAVVSETGIWGDDGEEVCKGVQTCAAVHAHADAFTGECERRDDDPGRAGCRAECEGIAVGGETVNDDLDLLPKVERRIPLRRGLHGVAEERAHVVPENVVVRVRLDGPVFVSPAPLDDTLWGRARSRGHGYRACTSAEPGQHHVCHVLTSQSGI